MSSCDLLEFLNYSSKSCKGYFVLIDIRPKYIYIQLRKSGNDNYYETTLKDVNDRNDFINKFRDFESNIIRLNKEIYIDSIKISVPGEINNDSVNISFWYPDYKLEKELLLQALFTCNDVEFVSSIHSLAAGIISKNDLSWLTEAIPQIFDDMTSKGCIVSKSRAVVISSKDIFNVVCIMTDNINDEKFVFPVNYGKVQAHYCDEKNKNYDEEKEIFQFFSNELYNGKITPTFEDITSYNGLTYLYQFFTRKTNCKTELNKTSYIELINDALNKKDNYAIMALRTRFRFLLRAAKTITTTLFAETCIIDDEYCLEMSKIFNEEKKEFYTYVRDEWINGIRLYTIANSAIVNLTGLASLQTINKPLCNKNSFN